VITHEAVVIEPATAWFVNDVLNVTGLPLLTAPPLVVRPVITGGDAFVLLRNR